MAISFEWYEDPCPTGREQEEKTLHPRIKFNGSTSTETLRKYIQNHCSLTKTDVSAVLDALSQVLGEELANGKRVHLDGIGYFYPTLTCSEPITASTIRKTTKVRLKAINFRADKKLRKEFGKFKVHCLESNPSFERITDGEIDERLTEFFGNNQYLRRIEFQYLCGMTESTARNCLRTLREAGKLVNIGTASQPIYVPGEGYYGK